MNKAITEGFDLNIAPFSAGLNNWSSANGRPGDASYTGAAGVTLVENDADFGHCLEVQKTVATQKFRAFVATPLHPDMYLRIRLRVKAMSGSFAGLRIALWPGSIAGAHVSNVTQTGPQTNLTAYGEIVTVEAIIGAGNRPGVDMVLGAVPSIAQIGFDLTGANGGIFRIESLSVQDVTLIWQRDLADVVDVRDHGALGTGQGNDLAAFQRADAAAQGRTILVPKGVFQLSGNLTLSSPVRFVGTVSMPAANRLVLTRNYDLETYSRAFGSDAEGFSRAMQALYYFNDHTTFDMSGRRVDLDRPFDVAAAAGLSSFAVRRVLRNGSFNAVASAHWAPDVATSTATYTPSGNNLRLTNVANIANIAVGSLVQGEGVGREVYVRSKNVGGGWLELSQPLFGGGGTRSYTFRRFKYLLDFSGFSLLSRFEIQEVEFNCLGLASALMLPVTGAVNHIRTCHFLRPKDRGITSIGTGCQGLHIDDCQFHSDEQATPAQNRVSIGLNINANDVKLRNNRAARFRHFAVMNGSSHMIQSNHFFQGDEQSAGLRLAGLILTQTNVATVISGNYVDNCSIEWGNEHDSAPEFNNEFSFGGLNIIGNTFIASNVTASFRWLVVKPYGAGHFLNGFSFENNSCRVFNATIERIDHLDTSYHGLDFSRSRDVRVQGNTFNQVSQAIANPQIVRHVQNAAAETWDVTGAGFVPFGGRIRTVEAVQVENALTTAANANRYLSASAYPGTGAGGQNVQLRWGEAVKGRAIVTMRMDVQA